MIQRKLTSPRLLLHNEAMTWRGNGWTMLVLVLGASLAGGCITVNAPEEPIVIELNINIKQEVIYRLAADAGNTIENNPDIF